MLARDVAPPTPSTPRPREVGLAGEHYVAMRLAMAGLTPVLLPARTEDADVIAALEGRACTLQVKTAGAVGRGPVDMKPSRITHPDFLVIVMLNMAGRYRGTAGEPVAYVVPREDVTELWRVGGYNHPKRPVLRTRRPGVPELLEKHREAWHRVVAALA